MLSGIPGYCVQDAQAQSAAERQHLFDIPAQSVPQALNAIGRVAGISVVVNGGAASGVRSQAVSGSLTARQALSAALAGTGLTYSFTNANTVTVFDPNTGAQTGGYAAEGETVQLETIDVANIGGGRVSPEDLPFEVAAPVSYISGETIDRFKGTTPSDILRSAPGVFSGESRNSGGLDVNIRGMQGMNRVPVRVDGATNSTAVYRGYQGIANRTYIDPDFIGGVTIERGPSTDAAGAGAIGDMVSLRTINADDILLDGESLGVRLRAGFGTNTSSFNVGDAGLLQQAIGGGYTAAGPIDRPGLFEPTSGYGNFTLAGRSENADFVAGFSKRKSGNYHAGENGSSAPDDQGPHTYCRPTAPFTCTTYDPWFPAVGLTPYLGGEEVLNTSADTTSWLAKATLRPADDHALELGYSHYESEYGEVYSMNFYQPTTRPSQYVLATVDVDTYTARYRWNPAENDLIDFRWNAWASQLVEYSAPASTVQPVGKFANIWGGDISNASSFDTSIGDFVVRYGGAFQSEDVGPEEDSMDAIRPRWGVRQEYSAFASGDWRPTSWLKLESGVRYQSFETENRDPAKVGQTEPSGDTGGYWLGASVFPVEGVELYASYKDLARLPSIMESLSGFQTIVAPDIEPERANNFDVGVNIIQNGLFSDADTHRIKLSYFHNDIENYIHRHYKRYPEYGGIRFLTIENIDLAKFEGIELTYRLDYEGFSAELNGSYYTNVEFCRTADSCINSSIASDYATNQIPPEYSANLTLTQKLFDDALTLGGRVTYVGPRAAGAEPSNLGGGAPFISAIPWDPYTVVDLFAEYKINRNATLNFAVENAGDRYYVEPMSLTRTPAPGRTIRAGLTAKF